jgi:hypothetical protein
MANPLLFGLKSVTMPGIGVGVAAAIAAQRYARPLAVETIRLGFQVKDGTQRIWNDARAAASGLAEEARKDPKAAARSTAKSAS